MDGRAVIGRRIVWHETTASTNDDARRAAEAGEPEGLVVIADVQTAGRGRMSRSWVSPPGRDLLFSVLLRPEPVDLPKMPLLAGLAVARTLDAFTSTRVTLKWPNDVLVEGRKISGILLEAAPGGGGLDWLVIGCGINIVSHPKLQEGKATSLAAEGASAPALDSVLDIFLQALHGGIARWEANGFAPVREDWLTSAHGVGRPIVVRLPGETLRGTFSALDENGALKLELAGGGERLVTGGEVYFGGGGETQPAQDGAQG